jgi:Tfp pilus assembly protein PilO
MNPNKPSFYPNSLRKYYRPLEPILKKPKNRMYTATVLSFLTVSLFVWYAIRPTVQTILSLRREIKDNTVINRQMETKIETLVEALSVYQSVEDKLPFLEQSIPKDPSMVQIMMQIRNLANASGATISGMSTGSSPVLNPEIPVSNTKPPVFSTVTTPVVINIEGSYQSLRQFLEGITRMRRTVTVSEFMILPQATVPNLPTTDLLNMTLKIQTFSTGG